MTVRSCLCVFFFSSRRRHTRYWRDWSSDVCSSDLTYQLAVGYVAVDLDGLVCLHRLDDVRAILMGALCGGRYVAVRWLLQAAQTVAQVPSGPAEVEPVVGFGNKARHELVFDHPGALAEVRRVLAGVAARFGNEVPEMLHELDAHGLLSTYLIVTYRLPDLR